MVQLLVEEEVIQEEIQQSVADAVLAIEQLRTPESLNFIECFAQKLSECFRRGNKVIIAGNGGSLCDAAHFAEELTGFFRRKRPALPAISLSDPGHITCTANDIGFDYVFSRGVEAYGETGDVFVALTTSGNSPNLINAVKAAKERGLLVVNFLGKDGGALKSTGDLELIIEGFSTSDRIQEAHMAAIHISIQLVEKLLYG